MPGVGGRVGAPSGRARGSWTRRPIPLACSLLSLPVWISRGGPASNAFCIGGDFSFLKANKLPSCAHGKFLSENQKKPPWSMVFG